MSIVARTLVMSSPCKLIDVTTQHTRSDAQPDENFDAHAVEDVLFTFFHDSSDSHAKARWLRRAMKLPKQCDDELVEERLQRAVADCFVLLQGRVLVSARYIACVALFLHLQSLWLI